MHLGGFQDISVSIWSKSLLYSWIVLFGTHGAFRTQWNILVFIYVLNTPLTPRSLVSAYYFRKFFLLYKRILSRILNPSHPNPGQREKIKLNFYFHTSLWWLKRFYEGLKGLHKILWGTTESCENKKFNLIFISIELSEMHGTGRVNVYSKNKSAERKKVLPQNKRKELQNQICHLRTQTLLTQ